MAALRWVAGFLFAFVAGACGGAGSAVDLSPVYPASAPSVAHMLSLDRMPSGIARIGERTFIALPRWVEAGDATVVEWTAAGLAAYPSAAANDLSAGPSALTSVNGLHADSRGWLWILDNGRVDLAPAAPGAPKLVVWDTVNEREVFRHVFSDEIAPPGASFLNDLAVDEAHGFVYITQSGMGGPASLITLEIQRDRARALLVGHPSVSADPTRDMVIDGEVVLLHRPDGPTPWRVGANAIALSPDGETLYWGPMSSERLYRVATRMLRDPEVDPTDLDAAISSILKPISDGIAMSAEGRLFATDVENARIVELDLTGEAAPRDLVADPYFSFPVAIETDAEGGLWFTSNQLHRMPLLRAGDDAREPPYYLWRLSL